MKNDINANNKEEIGRKFPYSKTQKSKTNYPLWAAAQKEEEGGGEENNKSRNICCALILYEK